MKVNRNDPCPCGSGKKYKKCCLKKEERLKQEQYQKNQYYQIQQVLINQIHEFIFGKISYSEQVQLQSQFTKRTERKLSKKIETSFFRNWLYFYYLHENGLRGVEWFFQENKHRLSDEVSSLAAEWTELTPKLLQYIDQTEEVFVFQDMLTTDQFMVSNDAENMPQSIPWLSTISMIHLFQEHYYFQGLRPIVGPETMHQAVHYVKELQLETKQSYAQLLMGYYPEIVTILLKGQSEDTKKQEEYTMTYHVNDVHNVSNYLQAQSQLELTRRDEKSQEFKWYGTKRMYSDTELQKPIKVKYVHASIALANGKLQVSSLNKDRVQQLKQLLDDLGQGLQWIGEKEEVLQEEIANEKKMVVYLEEDIPPYFSLYAKQELEDKVDSPLPEYAGLSIRQLVEQERTDDALAWLKQSEYAMYQTALHRFNKVDITADFNSVRKTFGLPLSPFVTGGSERVTSYQEMTSKVENQLNEPLRKSQQYQVKQQLENPEHEEQNRLLLEELGFSDSPDTLFYQTDMLHFYKEKAVGKSDSTIRKYRNSLFDLREILQKKDITSWEDCNAVIWEEIMMSDYFDLHPTYTKTARRDYLSTVKAFMKWIEQ